MNYADIAAFMQLRQRQSACPCAYCQGRGMASSMCPCAACQRAASNANLARLGAVAGDVRGYANYGQRSGGCGCNGKR